MDYPVAVRQTQPEARVRATSAVARFSAAEGEKRIAAGAQDPSQDPGSPTACGPLLPKYPPAEVIGAATLGLQRDHLDAVSMRPPVTLPHAVARDHGGSLSMDLVEPAREAFSDFLRRPTVASR